MLTDDQTPADSDPSADSDDQQNTAPVSSSDDDDSNASQSPVEDAQREQDRQLESGEESPSA